MPPTPRSSPTSRRSFLTAALAIAAGCSTAPGDPGSGDGAPTGTGTQIESPSPTEPTSTESTVDRPPFTHWAYETPHGALGSVTLAPGAGGPAVYATSAVTGPDDSTTDHAITAISLPDGTEQWQVSLPNPAVRPPLYGGDDGPPRLYVATAAGVLRGEGSKFHAVDPERGEEAWQFDIQETRHLLPLAATDDAVVVGRQDDDIRSSGEAVYALEAADGTERWRLRSGDAIPAGSIARRGTVLIQHAGGLLALDPGDGEERWRIHDEDGLVDPTYDNRSERVFLGQEDTVRAVALEDGSEQWRKDLDSPVFRVAFPRRALSDRVLVADAENRVHALSPLSGETSWTVSGDGPSFSPRVQRTSQTLFVDGMPGVLALDPVFGEERWSFAPDVGGPLRAHASTAVFASSDDRLWSLDPATGEERWSFEPGTEVVGPANAGEFAFVGVGGMVLALDGTDTS